MRKCDDGRCGLPVSAGSRGLAPRVWCPKSFQQGVWKISSSRWNVLIKVSVALYLEVKIKQYRYLLAVQAFRGNPRRGHRLPSGRPAWRVSGPRLPTHRWRVAWRGAPGRGSHVASPLRSLLTVGERRWTRHVPFGKDTATKSLQSDDLARPGRTMLDGAVLAGGSRRGSISRVTAVGYRGW
jgi:hypothetical protein